MFTIRSVVPAAALLVAASVAAAGETCCSNCGVQLNTADRTTSALMLGASTNNRIDVAPLLAQRPLRVGVDDVRRPGFNGMNWNGNNPGANQDCYAAGYGAAGSESAVILVHAGPRHIVAIHPFAPIPTMTADGQPMSPELVKHLEAQRGKWLSENGYTGGVRTFTNDRPQKAEKKDARAIKPRAIIELNPEAPRLKGRMEVRVTPQVPAVVGVATTNDKNAESKTAKADASAEVGETKPAAKEANVESKPEQKVEPKVVQPSMKVALSTTNSTSSR